ncbi:hypothetical protein [Nocardia sp. alder85J]|uniref:hypothetical protein n=1 Tax=Nocardia sp. alder85J TaxID=2862949 RepID=UPI001CD3D9E4|nr:hypothetical protein [Nocardia sp. alder85J]MCX4091934.1 hypothetical protein [Nocardia sp. alder85J]
MYSPRFTTIVPPAATVSILLAHPVGAAMPSHDGVVAPPLTDGGVLRALPDSWSGVLKYLPANAGAACSRYTRSPELLTPRAGSSSRCG